MVCRAPHKRQVILGDQWLEETWAQNLSIRGRYRQIWLIIQIALIHKEEVETPVTMVLSWAHQEQGKEWIKALPPKLRWVLWIKVIQHLDFWRKDQADKDKILLLSSGRYGTETVDKVRWQTYSQRARLSASDKIFLSLSSQTSAHCQIKSIFKTRAALQRVPEVH